MYFYYLFINLAFCIHCIDVRDMSGWTFFDYLFCYLRSVEVVTDYMSIKSVMMYAVINKTMY